jgi:hypothetical protein
MSCQLDFDAIALQEKRLENGTQKLVNVTLLIVDQKAKSINLAVGFMCEENF